MKNNLFYKLGRRISRRLLRFVDKSTFSAEIKERIRILLVNPLIKMFLYDEYVDNQIRRSSWSREIEKSRLGLERAYEALLPVVNDTMSVVDVGCGDGYFLDLLRSKVKNIFGIDYHFGKIKLAYGQGNVVLQGDFHDLPFSTSSVDVVHCSHALEHALMGRKVVSELHRILKNQGFLLLVVPSTGGGSIKHPTAFSEVNDLRKIVSGMFEVVSVWEAETREPEIWALCKAEK